MDMEQRIVKTGQHSGNTPSGPHLGMTITAELVPRFFSLLSAGFSVSVKAGCSINELLSQEFGISEAYIDDRIQTIFLNGKAVDDSKSATLQEGASLAFSAAMPGMVGSTFRKGGVFAGMRSQISHVTDPSVHHDRQIEVKLKLFNLIARELGQGFLERGVWLKGKQMQHFISENFDYLNQECKSVTLDEQDIDLSKLSQIHLTSNWVQLQVKTGQKSVK
jgi:hypothetical protein